MRYIVIVLIIFIAACKKTDYTFSNNEITETDKNGNLIGNVNPTDWQLLPLSAATEFDKNIFKQVNIGSVPFDYTKYHSCDSVYDFNLITYPNPLTGSSCTLKFNFNTTITIKEGQLIVALRDGKVVASGGNTDGLLPTEYHIPALMKRDFIIYYLFITDDNCLYFGRGNVIGC